MRVRLFTFTASAYMCVALYLRERAAFEHAADDHGGMQVCVQARLCSRARVRARESEALPRSPHRCQAGIGDVSAAPIDRTIGVRLSCAKTHVRVHATRFFIGVAKDRYKIRADGQRGQRIGAEEDRSGAQGNNSGLCSVLVQIWEA